ncbi:MAG: flippase-like domain-containing protein [Chloroflexi bacterium]|nr:flippase-like domain-containing protein [Chloroflexota bacterium]
MIAVAGMLSVYAARARLGEYAARLIGLLPGVGRRDAGSSDTASKMTGDILDLDRTVATRALLWSLAISLTQATMLFFITRSVGVDLSYPFMVAVWGIIALSLLLPLSVNGVGTREAILVTAFSAVDRSTDAAVAIGLLTLVIVGIGSSPGLIEWVRRTLVGSDRRLEEQAAVAESGRAP